MPSSQGRKVLVVGDIMLDRYWHGESLRLSPEAPVPIVHFDRADDRAGGAANVALNVRAQGAECVLVGAVADDEAGRVLRDLLVAAGVELDLFTVPAWRTLTKLRVVARAQQLLRVDFETPLASHWQSEVHTRVRRHVQTSHAVVLADYDKGTLEEPQTLIAALRRVAIPIVVDPKHKALSAYRGATVIKPNQSEFERSFGAIDEQSQQTEVQAALNAHAIDALLLTRGERGMRLYQRQQAVMEVQARRIEVFDVTGAGDTVAATLAVALAGGKTLEEATLLSNVAAAIAVTRRGTAIVSHSDIEHELRGDPTPARGVVSRDRLLQLIAAARARGERIVLTNGCFDVLHAGHVRCLQEAKALGERLIVAVNGDQSVARLKGIGRPINTLEYRAQVLAALTCVDWVVSFDEDTPTHLLAMVRPDLLVKGGDYRVDEVVGADVVRSYGGEVRVLGHIDALSTSSILKSLREN